MSGTFDAKFLAKLMRSQAAQCERIAQLIERKEVGAAAVLVVAIGERLKASAKDIRALRTEG